jgi:hypothetical protein
MAERHNDHVTLGFHELELWHIATPAESCHVVRTGVLDSAAVETAEQMRFDQLPVQDESNQLLGTVATKHVRFLLDSEEPLRANDPAIELNEITEAVELLTLTAELCQHRALIVRPNESDNGSYSLVTISDLNRRPVRALIYPALAQLEELMANFIDDALPDHWDWLGCLAEDAQARLVGRWEVEKRSSVDTDVMAGCTLSEMLKIVKQSVTLWRQLGVTSPNNFDKQFGSIPDLRNQVMHPVRPLVRDQTDVGKLHRRLLSVIELTKLVADHTRRFAQAA